MSGVAWLNTASIDTRLTHDSWVAKGNLGDRLDHLMRLIPDLVLSDEGRCSDDAVAAMH